MINVSWEDAKAYCAWLGAQTGQAYRLPTEAEWEYACRAGTTTPFSLRHDQHGAGQLRRQLHLRLGRKGVYREQTTPVGAFAANPWGLHDMHGNVWEWCEDRWHETYDGAPKDGSAWLQGILRMQGHFSRRVVRGGSWYYSRGTCAPPPLRGGPGIRIYGLGFRVSRTLTP